VNLVTGATGILGSHVVLNLLRNNQPVIACKQKGSDIKKTERLFSYYVKDYKILFEKITWKELDILDVFSIEEVLEDVTNVYHCAGFVSFNSKDRKKLFDINEKGTRNMVNSCLHKKIQALCYVSSVATINNLDYPLTLTEEVFWKKSGHESDYAISKYNAEREVWRGIEEGLNAVIVNPGVILSPGFWDQSSSRMFSTCYKGNIFYTNGMAGYIAGSDVARVMVELVSKKLFSNRYILVEDNYTFHNILSHIQTNFNKRAPYINTSGILLKLGQFLEGIWSFFTGKDRILTPALINAAHNKQVYSNDKVKAVLATDFEPTHKIIEEICRYHRLEKDKSASSV
jgi:dihydroflavonol-4-reductase